VKVFCPDIEEIENKKAVPFFNSSLHASNHEPPFELVMSISEADIIVPFYFVEHYYLNRKKNLLQLWDQQSLMAGKKLLLWTGGDFGITPKNLKNYRLLRLGGYASRNNGNEMAFPAFFEDPIPRYFKGNLHLLPWKENPIIGFCGQGKAGLGKWSIDMTRHGARRIQKWMGKWPYDLEVWKSSAYERSRMLDILEKDDAVETCFIRHRRYRAGATTPEEKEKGNILFYQNMKDSQYVVCYRGGGNFSVRLFQALACGRIPVIVESDNNLPLPSVINWEKFPTIDFRNFISLPAVIKKYHQGHDKKSFQELQLHSRHLWESALTEKGFLKQLFTVIKAEALLQN
jgi:hypothetical protein